MVIGDKIYTSYIIYIYYYIHCACLLFATITVLHVIRWVGLLLLIHGCLKVSYLYTQQSQNICITFVQRRPNVLRWSNIVHMLYIWFVFAE